MKKIYLTVLSFAFIATVAIPVTIASSPAGASSNKSQLLKAWTALETDYKNIESALNANNETNAESGFIAFSRDCVPLATYETTFNTTINADIFNIAVLGNAWAWTGYITLDSNLGLSDFSSESTKLSTAISKFTTDLGKYGLN